MGESYTATGEQHAFITDPSGVGITDLNSLVSPRSPVLNDAIGINNHGQVTATGEIPQNQPIPPIPEPGSYAMLSAGLALIGMLRLPDALT